VSPARTAAFSFALALILFGALLPAACGGGNASSDTAQQARAEPEEEPVDEAGKEWNGWRWKGKRGECFFRFGNNCYSKLEAACRAARCEGSRCGHDDGVPAVVSCRR
jgi:hypothetical protein